MDLRQLRYFIAAIEEGSLQAASRRVNITQPALSRQIKDLEDDLGCRLFDRSSRGVRLTRAGASFYGDVASLVEQLDKAKVRARQLGAEGENGVRMGLVRTSSKYRFPSEAFAAFHAEMPDGRISFTRGTSPDLSELMRGDQLDIALLYERQLDSRVFQQRLIHTERYVIAVHPQHGLARAESLHINDLVGVPLVWLSRQNNAEAHDALLSQCRTYGLEPVIGHLAESYEGQIELLCVGAGIGITSASSALSAPPGALLFHPLPAFELELHLRLVWTRQARSSQVTRLLGHLHAAIDSYTDDMRAGRLPWTQLADGTRVTIPPSA